MMAGRVLLGTRGWAHGGWVGPLYPEGTREPEMLRCYGAEFPTVEVGETFFGIPPAPVMTAWRDAVPQAFRFALQVPQQITHQERLDDPLPVLRRFLERADLLDDRLGPILVPLSPAFRPDERRRRILSRFLDALPDGYRYALEVRDRRWVSAALLERLRARNVALVLADGRWLPRRLVLDLAREPTADFAYVRWMGDGDRAPIRWDVPVRPDGDLSEWCDALGELASRVDAVYGYFHSRYGGFVPQAVRELRQRLEHTPAPQPALREPGHDR